MKIKRTWQDENNGWCHVLSLIHLRSIIYNLKKKFEHGFNKYFFLELFGTSAKVKVVGTFFHFFVSIKFAFYLLENEDGWISNDFFLFYYSNYFLVILASLLHEWEIVYYEELILNCVLLSERGFNKINWDFFLYKIFLWRINCYVISK